MDVPPEMLEPFSLMYQAVKQMAIDLVMDCHDPDYQATLDNIRKRISKMEEGAFQLKLFDYESVRTKAGDAAVS